MLKRLHRGNDEPREVIASGSRRRLGSFLLNRGTSATSQRALDALARKHYFVYLDHLRGRRIDSEGKLHPPVTDAEAKALRRLEPHLSTAAQSLVRKALAPDA